MLSPSSEEGYSTLRLQLSLKWPSSCPFHHKYWKLSVLHTALGVRGGGKVWWRNLRKRLMTAVSQSEGISRWCGGWLKFSALWSVMSREGVGTQCGLCCETHSLFLWVSGGQWPWTLSCVWWYWAAVCPLSCAASFNHDISPIPELCNQSVVQRWKLFEDLRLLAYSEWHQTSRLMI